MCGTDLISCIYTAIKYQICSTRAKNMIQWFLVYPFIRQSVRPSVRLCGVDVQLTGVESWDLLVHSFLLLWLSCSVCLLCFPTLPLAR